MATAQRTVRTSILIISDTHNASPFPNGVPADFPHIDLLLHAGDLTLYGTKQELNQTLDMLRDIPASVKLVIPGNHDVGLDKVWMARDQARLENWGKRNGHKHEWKGKLGETEWREVEQMWFGSDSRAVREGVTMLREGKVDIELKNGARAKIYASPYTTEFFDWGFAYYSHQDRFSPKQATLTDTENIAVNPAYTSQEDMRDLDIMITHGPPFGRMDVSVQSHQNVGCPHIMNALQHCRPKLHCFGHIHEGWGAERINWAAVEQKVPDLDSPCDTKAFRQRWIDLSDSDCISPVPVKLQGESNLVVVEVDSEKSAEETLLVNAAIMDVQYKPINRPWLVYVDLPVA